MMKKNIHILSFVLASVILLSGCQKGFETEISELKQRVQTLEAEVSTLNKSCQTLSDLVSEIENNDLISKVERMSDGSYRIVFASGHSIDLKNGKDGVMPVIGIEKSGDFYYWKYKKGENGYWTWLKDPKDDRSKVRASSMIPLMKVDGEGDKARWWYSYTGDDYDWHLLEGFNFPVHGYPGLPMFETVDCSYEGFVTITLADKSIFQIPTQVGFNRLNVICDTINSNMAIINDLIQEVDTMIFIKEIKHVENEGEPSGYDIVFADGRTFSLRNGGDTTDIKTLSIGWNAELSMNCWEIDGEPILYGGKAVVAEGIAPTVGVEVMNGGFYFTVAVGDGEPELLLDSEGNPVQASPARFFGNIEERDGGIELTLTGVGEGGSDRKIILVKAGDCIPYLHLSSQSEWKVSRNGGEGCFTASIDSLGINSMEEFKYELEAVAMEGACVDSVGTGVLTDASPKRSIEHQIYFHLNDTATAGDRIRIAVFLSWNNHTIMKVCEMTVKDPEPVPEVIIPE